MRGTIHANLNQILKVKLVRYYKKCKNKYHPKIETVKNLELMDQNKNWLIFTTDSKVCKCPELASGQSIFNYFAQISDL